MAEVQALVCAGTGDRRRGGSSRGLDSARVAMLLAVLERRADLRSASATSTPPRSAASGSPSRPSTWPSALAIASALGNVSIPADLVAIGEVGLAGEIRRVTGVQRRLAEAERLGFRHAIVPGLGTCWPSGPAPRAGLELEIRQAAAHPAAIAAATRRADRAQPRVPAVRLAIRSNVR